MLAFTANRPGVHEWCLRQFQEANFLNTQRTLTALESFDRMKRCDSGNI